MLYINGELLNTRNKSPEYKYRDFVTAYHKTIGDLKKKFGDVLRIQTKQKMFVDKKTGFPRYPATRGLNLQASVATDHGIDEWIYSPTTLRVEDGVVKLTDPNLLINKGEMFIDMRQNPDLAFFCIHTNKVGLNEHAPQKFHVVDLEGKNSEEAEQLRIEGTLANLIFTGIPESNLRTLAKSFGISNVDTKALDTVRIELHKKVLSDEAAKKKGGQGFRGIKEFIDSADVRFYDQVSAMVRDAEEKGILLYASDERKWEIHYKDGGLPYPLKEMSGTEFNNHTESLVKFLVEEPTSRHKLENALGVALDRPPSTEVEEPVPEQQSSVKELTIDDIRSETNYAKLKSLAKKYIPEFPVVKGVGVDQIKQALMTKLAVTENAG
jgi:hypothetical protein